MNKIKNVTFVNGNRVDDMSADDLIHTIASTEADIVALEKLSTKSDAIEKRIAKLKSFAEGVAGLLDKKTEA